MSEINKLQLVNPSKMNEILELIKSDHDNNKLLQGIKKKGEYELLESKKKMEHENKNNFENEKNMVDFIKKKGKVKRKAETSLEEEEEEDEFGETSSRKSPSTISENQIKNFLKRKGAKVKDHKIKLNNYEVNYEDMLYDLSHNVTKSQNFNLTKSEHFKVFKELKKMSMPVSYIRNQQLRQLLLKDPRSDSESDSSIPPIKPPFLPFSKGKSKDKDYLKQIKKRRK